MYMVMEGKRVLAYYRSLEGATEYYMTVGGPAHDHIYILRESVEVS